MFVLQFERGGGRADTSQPQEGQQDPLRHPEACRLGIGLLPLAILTISPPETGAELLTMKTGMERNFTSLLLKDSPEHPRLRVARG